MARKRTEITSPDREKLEQLLATTDDPRQRERLLAARMAMTGSYTLVMIAKAVGRARSAVQVWLEKFVAGGLDALIERRSPTGREPSLSEAIQAQVQEHLRLGTWRTADQFRQWLIKEHGIQLSQTGGYYWLGKCEGRLKAPRPCHRSQAPGAIAEFKTEGWENQLAKLDLPPGEPVCVWVMDEARFGLHTIVRHCWGLRGHRVIKPFQQKYDWDYLCGAINVIEGEPVFAHLPALNAQNLWAYLRQIVRTRPEAHHVILWDGAGFHQPPPQEPEWAELSKVHLITLPAYCPELNPTEKIWDQIKDVICNQVFATIEALREAILPKLRSFWESPDGLSSLIGQTWLRQKANASSRNIIPVSNCNWYYKRRKHCLRL